MCGISGYFNPNKEINFKSQLERMAYLQEHRGPDHTGYYFGAKVGLAHNRLSLLDLSEAGNQPFENERYVLIYNGEIYNFKEIEGKLQPYIKTSSSDTEVLFHCLIQWGIEKTLQSINGMFAFAFFDKDKNELFLARDRFAIKPLFYGTLADGTLCFASESKAIIHTWPFEPDPIQVLFSSLAILEKSDHLTAWKNLFILPAGAYLKVNENSSSTHHYFNISTSINENEYRRLEKSTWGEVIEQFDELFGASVQKMLVSDALMGVFVSGGIDSSLIAHESKKHQGKRLKLFTTNVLGPHSEFEDAQTLAQSLEVPLLDYRFEEQLFIDNFVAATWHYEAPIVNHNSALPFASVASLAHQHNIKAVLTGEGADELFFGYPKLLTKRYDALIQAPYALINTIYKRVPNLGSYLNPNLGGLGILNVFEQASTGYGRKLRRGNQIDKYDFLSKDKHTAYLSAQMMQEGIRSLMWRNDRMGMMHGIESRFPFLDEKIVAFAMNLPVKYKIARTSRFYNFKHPFLMDKAIVRKSAQQRLPKQLVYKKKNGFPLKGLREVVINPSFFYYSNFANIFHLQPKQIDCMLKDSSSYHTALLGAFEVWAELFVAKKTIDEVQLKVQQHWMFK
jgi:asparagine synthase (glutamine-hydrolysing)